MMFERNREPRPCGRGWAVDVTDLTLSQLGLVRVRWKVPTDATIEYGHCGSHQCLLTWEGASPYPVPPEADRG